MLPLARLRQVHDSAILPVGQSKRSWILAGGYQIAGITVDNPSGSWLFIPQDGTFVPPYTLDFAHSFNPTLSRVDVLFQDGPSNQVSTIEGDPPLVRIYDRAVAEAAGVTSGAGSAFIRGFTPTVNVTAGVVLAGIGSAGIAVLGVFGKRWRLRSYSMHKSFNGILGAQAHDTPIAFALTDGLNTLVQVYLSNDHPMESLSFGEGGIDWPVSADINWNGGGVWAASGINYTLVVELL